jgi:hypothetical protein
MVFPLVQHLMHLFAQGLERLEQAVEQVQLTTRYAEFHVQTGHLSVSTLIHYASPSSLSAIR